MIRLTKQASILQKRKLQKSKMAKLSQLKNLLKKKRTLIKHNGET